MKVVADELRVRERLRHCDGRPAMAASDIGDLGAARQLLEDAVEGGEPGTDQMVVVARAEEARHRAKHAAGLLAPGDPAAGAKRLLDLWLIVEQRRHKIEAAQHVDGA